MKKMKRICRTLLCLAVVVFATTTAVMGCYQTEPEIIEIPLERGEPSSTADPQPSVTPAGEVIPTVDRQAELAEAKKHNPDTAAWLYIPGAEVDDPVMQAEDNGYYLNLDENREYSVWGCYYAHCENTLSGRDALDRNTTIFGHSASDCNPDGPKFTRLHRYLDAEFVAKNPCIYLSVDGDDLIFQIKITIKGMTKRTAAGSSKGVSPPHGSRAALPIACDALNARTVAVRSYHYVFCASSPASCHTCVMARYLSLGISSRICVMAYQPPSSVQKERTRFAHDAPPFSCGHICQGASNRNEERGNTFLSGVSYLTRNVSSLVMSFVSSLRRSSSSTQRWGLPYSS